MRRLCRRARASSVGRSRLRVFAPSRPVPLWITHPSIHPTNASFLASPRARERRATPKHRSIPSFFHPSLARPSHRVALASRIHSFMHACIRASFAPRSSPARSRSPRSPPRRASRRTILERDVSARVDDRRRGSESRIARKTWTPSRACVCASTIDREVYRHQPGWREGSMDRVRARWVLGPYWSVCMPMCDVCIRYEYLVILRVQYRHVYSDIWHFPRVGRSSVVRRVSSRHTRARAFPTLERVGRDSWSGLERERSRASSTRSDSNDSKEGANERTNGRDGVRGGSPRARGRVDEKVRAVNARSARVGSLSSSLSRVDRCESEDARAG